MEKKRVGEAVKIRRKRTVEEVIVECKIFTREVTNGITSEQSVKEENIQISRMMVVELM